MTGVVKVGSQALRLPCAGRRERILRNVFSGAKEDYTRALIILPYGEVQDTHTLRSSLRHYAAIDANLQRHERSVALVASAFTGGATGVLIAAVDIEIVGPYGNFVVAIIPAFLASLYFLAILRAPLKGNSRLAALLGAGLVVYGVATLIDHGANRQWLVVSSTSDNYAYRSTIDSFAVFAMAVTTLGIVFFALAVVLGLINGPGRRRNSNVVIINTLAHVLETLVEHSPKKNEIGTRAEICHELQFAADYLQEGIPRALRLSDQATRHILQEKLTSSAAYLRGMQLRLVLADDKANDDVRDTIARYIQLIAQGEYGLLPESTLTAVPRDKKRDLVRFGRTLIIAIVPLGCLLGIRYSGLQSSPSLTGWAVIVAVAWAAITLISALDPLYKKRLNDIQDLITTIRGNKT